MNENELSHMVIGAAIEAHKELGGPGLLEDIYEQALCVELESKGLDVQRQVGIKVKYKGNELKKRLGADLLVNDLLIIEVKSTAKYNAIFESQLLTYL